MEGVICWYARMEDLPLARSVWESHAATVRAPFNVRLNATHGTLSEWILSDAHPLRPGATATKGCASRMAIRCTHRSSSHTCDP